MIVHAIPPNDTNPPGFFNALDGAPPDKPKPHGSDRHPLRAEYPLAAFSAEIMGDRPVEVILGESVHFRPLAEGDHWLATEDGGRERPVAIAGQGEARVDGRAHRDRDGAALLPPS